MATSIASTSTALDFLALDGQAVVRRLGIGILTAAVALAIWFGLPGEDADLRLALIAFAVATIAWIGTKLGDTYVAFAAALTLVLTGVTGTDQMFATLGSELVWLLVAAFVIAAAANASGLSHRLAAACTRRARDVRSLFYGLTAAIFATAFFIPSTSGRAALLLPVALALSKAIANPRVSKALMIMVPTVILLSAMASLIGAGAHVLAAEFITQLTGRRIGFFDWMLFGAPFALVSSFASTWVILHLFLDRDERRLPIDVRPAPPAAGGQGFVLAVVAGLVLLWTTEPLHGLDNALIAIVGALIVTSPRLGPISLKDGIKTVEWNLILFLAATLAMSQALTGSGAAAWAGERLLSVTAGASTVVTLAIVSCIALAAHLLIASRSARASVLVPLVGLFALSAGLDPTSLIVLTVAATGYCLTLTASAKPVALFSTVEVPTYGGADLLRLSAVLLPLHFLLLMVFALLVWPALGLDSKAARPMVNPTAAVQLTVAPATMQPPAQQASGVKARVGDMAAPDFLRSLDVDSVFAALDVASQPAARRTARGNRDSRN